MDWKKHLIHQQGAEYLVVPNHLQGEGGGETPSLEK